MKEIFDSVPKPMSEEELKKHLEETLAPWKKRREQLRDLRNFASNFTRWVSGFMEI